MEEFENKENGETYNTNIEEGTVPEEEKHKKKCQCGKAVKALYRVVLINTIISLVLVVLTSIILFKVFTPQQIIIKNPMQPNAAFQNEGDIKRMPTHRKQINKQAKQEKPLFEKGLLGNNFKPYAEAKESDKKMFVLFYADWCPHCQRFSPTFEKLSKDRELKKTFNFVPLNSQLPETRAIMEEYDVQGFPALFIVNNQTGKKTFIPNNLLFEENAVQNLKDIAVKIK